MPGYVEQEEDPIQRGNSRHERQKTKKGKDQNKKKGNEQEKKDVKEKEGGEEEEGAIEPLG